MRLGLTVPLDGPLGEQGEALRSLYDGGYTDFWTAETARCDAFTPLAHAAAVLPEARFGTAIASVFARGPALLAMSAAAIAEAAPGRFVLGVGASSPVMAAWNGVSFERPLERVRDTVRFLRSAMAGERVGGFRLDRPAPVPVLVAALRPRMLRLAADEADGAVLNWLAADDLPRVRAELAPDSTVAARIFVCPSEDPDTVRAAARRLVATYASVPAYAAFHRWLGRGDALAACWAATDRKAAAAAVPDDVVDALIVHGPIQACADHVRRYVAGGVDVPILKLLPLDPSRDALADALSLAAALQ